MTLELTGVELKDGELRPIINDFGDVGVIDCGDKAFGSLEFITGFVLSTVTFGELGELIVCGVTTITTMVFS